MGSNNENKLEHCVTRINSNISGYGDVCNLTWILDILKSLPSAVTFSNPICVEFIAAHSIAEKIIKQVFDRLRPSITVIQAYFPEKSATDWLVVTNKLICRKYDWPSIGCLRIRDQMGYLNCNICGMKVSLGFDPICPACGEIFCKGKHIAPDKGPLCPKCYGNKMFSGGAELIRLKDYIAKIIKTKDVDLVKALNKKELKVLFAYKLSLSFRLKLESEGIVDAVFN